jgi:hypothetical protein
MREGVAKLHDTSHRRTIPGQDLQAGAAGSARKPDDLRPEVRVDFQPNHLLVSIETADSATGN